MSKQFNLDEYILGTSSTVNRANRANLYDDVFNESLYDDIPNTFPVIDDDNDEYIYGDTQQNNLSPSSNLNIKIPDNSYDDLNDVFYNTHNNIRIILDFSKEVLLISSISDKNLYIIPSINSNDARTIWKQAKIPTSSYIRHIEIKLLDWAFINASLEINNKSILSIVWKTSSNCICKSKWSAFLCWIICASFSQSR